MARFWTSDLHLGHTNIVKFCNRPFLQSAPGCADEEAAVDLSAMHDWICARLNSQVGAQDELWVLGDAAMGSINDTLAIRSRLLAGRVVLVPGNHDRCHPMHARHQEWTARYQSAGWEVTDPVLNVRLGPVEVKVSHFPYAGPFEDHRSRKDRFADWRPIDDGSWLLCGHVHDSYRQRGKIVNVGIDAWGGNIVAENDLVQVIEHGPTDREVVSWAESAGKTNKVLITRRSVRNDPSVPEASRGV